MTAESHSKSTGWHGVKSRKSLVDGLLNRLVNPCTRFVLRSPFHGLLSGSVMLVSVRGRKSGRTYTTPANYVRDANIVTAVSNLNRTWWKNVGVGAPVSLRIRGRDLSGEARVLQLDPEAFARRLQDFYSHISPFKLSRQKASELATKKVLIEIDVPSLAMSSAWESRATG